MILLKRPLSLFLALLWGALTLLGTAEIARTHPVPIQASTKIVCHCRMCLHHSGMTCCCCKKKSLPVGLFFLSNPCDSGKSDVTHAKVAPQLGFPTTSETYYLAHEESLVNFSPRREFSSSHASKPLAPPPRIT